MRDSSEEKLAIANEINFWYEEVNSYIGEVHPTNMHLKIAGQLSDCSIDSDNAVLLADNLGTYIPAEEMFPGQPDSLKKQGKEAVIFVQEKAKQRVQDTSDEFTISKYEGYNRIRARDYALNWTSQVPLTSAYKCTHGLNVWRDRTKWKCHADCANYVSQAMRHGYLPTDDTWKPYTAAWMGCSAMKQHLYVTKKYWDLSNFTVAAAGGVIYWTQQGHIVMITLNDTVNRRYSAHTTINSSR